jgi:dUTP pyrophosphatase
MKTFLLSEIFSLGYGTILHGSKASAGWDIISTERKLISPQQFRLFFTGLYLSDNFKAQACPEYWIELRDRSGLALKGLHVFAGVIDSDYPDEIGVVLFNHSFVPYTVEIGDRICQFIPHGFRISEEDKEPEGRTGGFGSTGK